MQAKAVKALKPLLKQLEAEALKRDIVISGANGETRFHFDKMPATVGDDTLEIIREAVGMDMADDPFAAIGRMPRAPMRELRNAMFAHVTFTNRIMKEPTVLKGMEEPAFDAIEAEPISIKLVLMRALAVNFTGSFRALYDGVLWISSLLPSTKRSQPTP